jgi:DNA anti-recombination protein RmuC
MHRFKPMPANDNMGEVVFELRELRREIRTLGDDLAASNAGQGKLTKDVQGTLTRLNGKLDKLAAQ